MSTTEATSSPPTPSQAPAPAERFTPIQKIAMAVLLTANFTLAVDFSILNVALPHIGTELGFPTSALQWIVTSFALCAAGFTLFFGRVADLFGRKRLFMIGIVLLGVSSLAGGLATEPVLLIAARVGQGIATAMVTPAALSLMTTMFPEGPARSKALGLNGALMAAGFTAGAVLGGLLTGAVSWRWAFFINVVVAVAVIVVAPFVLREPARGARPKLDVPGAITITLALVALVFGIDTAGHAGWTHPGTWGPILAALILFVVFFTIEGRVKEPLVAPGLLKRRNIGWGNTAGLLAFGTFTSLVFLLTLYLQQILGYSAITAGLILGVLGIGTVIGGLIAPKIIGKTSAKTAIVAGLVVQAAATAPLAFAGDSRNWLIPILVLTFVGGIANLVAIVGYVVASTAGVPADKQGLATGLVTMSQQVGIALGTPVMSAIATGVVAATLLPGLQLAIGVNAAIAIGAAILLAIVLRLPKAAAPAEAPEPVEVAA
ncbi:MFS transporter [Brachybacterium alimentarium]|uniref:MFS transporter n=1 Tax=Brachybacterium alimentarium TaxID=47845 RepID=UPI000A1A6E1F|nr:MFS transporter [Brachybacterium alimentarium]RCS82606.1 MFS transporter [Brachybacterium alimentarium]SLM99821.1 Probable transmembrane transport protein [Corynebacterium xerosis]